MVAHQGTPLMTDREEHEALAEDDSFMDESDRGSRISQDSDDDSAERPDTLLEQELDAAEDAETLRKSHLEDYNSDVDNDCSTPVTLFHAGYSIVSFPVRTQEYHHTTHGESYPEQVTAEFNVPSVRPPSRSHNVLNRQPTVRRHPTEPKPDSNLVTWDENDPASPHSKFTTCH